MARESRWCLVLCLSCVGIAPLAPAGTPKIDAPDAVKAAMVEMWRRGTCLLSSVLEPAARESAVPKDVGDLPVLAPRLIGRTGEVLCYAVDARGIWAADDQSVYQVDSATGKLVRRFGQGEGLPDDLVQSIAPAGPVVWLATRSGLAKLDIKTGRITAVPGISFGPARLAVGASGVWLVSDAGAWRLAPGEDQWRKLPDFPGQDTLAQVAGRGFWWALWHQKLQTLISSIFANEDGLYVVCLNRLLRYSPADRRWQEIGPKAWEAMPLGRTVWALTTVGLTRYDPSAGVMETILAGKGLATGRAVGMAATKGALFVASEPDGDGKTDRFVGGGISRLDLATGKWSVTQKVDGQDIRFVTAIQADGEQVWAGCTLYDRTIQLSAHPGMAHVKRWQPHTTGLGLLRYAGGRWTLIRLTGPKTEKRWVLGQKNTVKADDLSPKRIDALCRCGDRLWGVYRMVPEQYYSGYYLTAGCLAAEAGGNWSSRFDARTEELALAGEYPELMLISHSHGVRIVLADGHPTVLGMESVGGAGGRAWAICQSGLFGYDAAANKFVPAVQEDVRLYWRAEAAAAGKDAVWFGGDVGTVSRLDRASGRLELVGIVPGRKVVAVAAKDNRVAIRTAKTSSPPSAGLLSGPKLPDADEIVFDGTKWSPGRGGLQTSTSALTCQKTGDYLYNGSSRVAFLKGVFRPTVLCEDPVGGKLWLGTYSGVASVPLSAVRKN